MRLQTWQLYNISYQIIEKCRNYGRLRGWRATFEIQPYVFETMHTQRIGIKIPESVNFLLFQENGIKPFLMTWAEGRVLPLKPHPVRVKGVGEPGFVKIPQKNAQGQVVNWETVFKIEKWKHPGIEATFFMERALLETVTSLDKFSTFTSVDKINKMQDEDGYILFFEIVSDRDIPLSTDDDGRLVPDKEEIFLEDFFER